VSGVQRLDVGTRTFSVDRSADGTVLFTVTADEGEQCTYRNAKGSLVIDLSTGLDADELEALVALLTGRQVAAEVTL